MKAQTALRIIPKPLPSPYDDTKGLKAITGFKAKMLSAAIRYIVDGKDGSRNDRLRTASNLSGIPRHFLEVEISKK